jgi:hypothetical protein
MGHQGRDDNFWSLQLDRSIPQVVKEPHPITQEYRHQVKPYFVEQSCLDALMSKRGTTQYIDLFLAGNVLCLGKHAFHPLSDEGKGCASILDQLFPLPMRKDKTGDVKGGILTPWPLVEVKRSSSHHHCPCRGEQFSQDIRIDGCLRIVTRRKPAIRFATENPFMQSPTLVVWSGNLPIQ